MTKSGSFVAGNALPSGPKPRQAAPGGFGYAYYEGNWEGLPDFRKVKPVRSGYTNADFDLRKTGRQNNFALLIEGYLRVEEEGYYYIGMSAGNGAKLIIGDQLLIHYDGVHGSGGEHTYIVPLQPGFYPVRVEYFRKSGEGTFALFYKAPGDKESKSIPLTLQYSRKKAI